MDRRHCSRGEWMQTGICDVVALTPGNRGWLNSSRHHPPSDGLETGTTVTAAVLLQASRSIFFLLRWLSDLIDHFLVADFLEHFLVTVWRTCSKLLSAHQTLGQNSELPAHQNSELSAHQTYPSSGGMAKPGPLTWQLGQQATTSSCSWIQERNLAHAIFVEEKSHKCDICRRETSKVWYLLERNLKNVIFVGEKPDKCD